MTGFRFLKFPPYADAPGDDCTEIVAQGSAGELLSLAFGIQADRPIDELAVASSDLRGATRGIPADALDLHVVKVWDQAGVGVYQSPAVRVPELLLKDDRVEFRGSYRTWCGHWRHLLQRDRYYRAPAARLTGAPRTTLVAGESKQIWGTLRIPADCAPGLYRGALSVSTQRDGRDIATLPVRVEVLPLTLMEPAQNLFLWYKGTLDCRTPQHYVSPTVLEAQLRDIYDHGFRSISLNESRPELLKRALAIATRVGFRGDVVVSEPFDDMPPPDAFTPATPVYYLSDELDARGSAAVSHHVANWRAAKRANARTMASLLNAATARRFESGGDIGHAPDVISLYLPENLAYFADGASRRSTFYYWLSHMEKPITHRVLAGVYLWRSGAAGIAPYCYQHLPRFPGSPFDDFDEWEPEFQIGREHRPFKDHMTTYPARGGAIPTVQWKGLADGITDLRYLTTVNALVERAEHAPSDTARARAAEIRAGMSAFLDRIEMTGIDIVSSTNRLPYPLIAPAEYRAFREQLARDGVALQAILRPDAAAGVVA